MARPLIDLTGRKFGALTVVERYGTDHHGKVTWKCDCDCGYWTIVRGNNLATGNTRTCGRDCRLSGDPSYF